MNVPRLVNRPNGDVWAVVPYGNGDTCVAYALRHPDGWRVRAVRSNQPDVVCADRAEAVATLRRMTGAVSDVAR